MSARASAWSPPCASARTTPAMATAKAIPKQTVDKDLPCRQDAPAAASGQQRGDMVMERTGVYPGTFDPVTSGHMEVVRRSLRLVDRLGIGPAINIGKGPLFSLVERI